MWGARKNSGWGISWTTSEPLASTPSSRRLQSSTRRTAQVGEQEAEHFMAKWIAAAKARAGLRHTVPNVTGRTKERIAQSKRARAGSLAIVD